jgi:hypothetical protein
MVNIMKNLSSIFILLIGTLLFTACSKDKAEPPPSPKAEYLLGWGSSGPRDSEFDQPIGIAIDDEGFIYISDSENNVIKKFLNSASSMINGAAAAQRKRHSKPPCT